MTAREAILDATAALVAEHGLTGVTMSQIARDTGIGRATLYKYFPDVESILHAWHQRQIDGHLKDLLKFIGALVTEAAAVHRLVQVTLAGLRPAAAVPGPGTSPAT